MRETICQYKERIKFKAVLSKQLKSEQAPERKQQESNKTESQSGEENFIKQYV